MTTAKDFCRYAPGLQRNAPLDRDTSPPFNQSRYICPACGEPHCDGPGDATCKARQT